MSANKKNNNNGGQITKAQLRRAKQKAKKSLAKGQGPSLLPGKLQVVSPYTRKIIEEGSMDRGIYRGNPEMAQLSRRKHLLAIIDPEATGGFRLPDEMQRQTTSIASVPMRITPGFGGAASQVGRALPLTQIAAVVRKTPQACAIVYDHNAGGVASTYTVSFVSTVLGTRAVGTTCLYVNPNYALGEWVNVHWIYARTTGAYQPHGGTLFAASATGTRATDKRYLWLDYSDTLNIQLKNSTGSSAIIVYRYWALSESGEEEELYTNQTASIPTGTAASGNLVMSTYLTDGSYVGKYVRLEISSSIAGNAGLIGVDSATITSSGAHFCHRSLPSLDSKSPALLSCRIIGASAMYSNKANVQDRNGDIVGYQFSKGSGKPFTEYMINADAVSAYPCAETKDAKNGMYAWLMPSGKDEFILKNYFTSINDVLVDSYWPIMTQDSDSLILIPRVAQTAGQVGLWTFNFAFEFQSNDPWFSRDHADLDYQQWSDSLQDLILAPQFFENPLHLRDVTRFIVDTGKKIGVDILAKGFLKYAPNVLSAISTYGPEAIAIAKMFALPLP